MRTKREIIEDLLSTNLQESSRRELMTWVPDLFEEYAQAKFDAAMVEEQNVKEGDDLFSGGIVAGWNMARSSIITRFNSQQ